MKKVILLSLAVCLFTTACEKNKIENYKIGQLVTCNDGTKGVVFSVNRNVKIVSIEEGSLLDWEEAQLWCHSYGVDWYIPTFEESNTIYALKDYLNVTLISNGYTPFYDGGYWTYDQDGRPYYRIEFSTGNTHSHNQSHSANVRAVKNL